MVRMVRMARTTVFGLAILTTFFATFAYAADTPSQRLSRLAVEARERWLDLSPLSETFGAGAGPRQDRLELTFTEAHRERVREHNRWVLHELDAIPFDALPSSEKLTHQLLAYQSREGLEWQSFPLHRHYLFIQIDGGVPSTLIKLVDRQPFRNTADYEAWLRRVQRFPRYLDGVADVLRDGIASNITVPRVIVERTLTQLESLAPDINDIAKSALWKPVQFPAGMDTESRARFEAAYRKLLAEDMLPALRRLAAFVRADYLPRARTSDGIGVLPQGAAMYRLAVKSNTTTDLSPDEIHALGLREVERIQTQFLAAGARAGFKGPINDFQIIRSPPASKSSST
jgi:uncharacterized protein (DUF885 family)